MKQTMHFSKKIICTYLTYVVSENWEYIERLINIGVDLRGANLTRLKWEFSEVFEKGLLNDEKIGTENQITDDLITTESKNANDIVNDFIEASKEISKRGYRFVPPVQKLINRYEQALEQNAQNKEILEQLEGEIGKIGKRKQKYLKRIANKVTT